VDLDDHDSDDLLAVVAVWGLRHRSLTPRIRSVTVLPLHDLSFAPNTQYFAGGMTEELISDLSAIPELRVVSDSSTAPVKDSPESLTETARKLSVDAVVQGSVLRSRDKISVDIRLFDARSDRQLKMKDLFSITSFIIRPKNFLIQIEENDKHPIETKQIHAPRVFFSQTG
jgi:TolB-like protein